MRKRTLLAAGAFSGVVLGSAGLVLEDASIERIGDGEQKTFALAPLSLGHPAAAAGLATRRVEKPGALDMTQPRPAATLIQRQAIGRGETLAGLLIRGGVSAREADRAIRAFAKLYDPRRLRPGQEIALRFRAETGRRETGEAQRRDRFDGFSFMPDFRHQIVVNRGKEGGYSAAKEERKVQKTLARVAAPIKSSLYLAGKAQGLPANVLAELIRIYSWDVDFQRDIRRGDSFEVLYEEVRDQDGKLLHAGTIHFAALTLTGNRKPLYRFVTADGQEDYFDDKGRGAKKALMRTPIDGARLSSGFGKRRHPILGYTRMHKGVDFAAPTGTPIYAAGDGVVTFTGRKGGYGNFLKIRHNGRYTTAYAHLNAFRRGVRVGKRVKQGQVVGYVGTTGRSTGPHLHYEIMVDGRQVNPMRVRMPSGKQLKGAELARFMDAKTRTDLQFAELRDNDKDASELAARN